MITADTGRFISSEILLGTPVFELNSLLDPEPLGLTKIIGVPNYLTLPTMQTGTSPFLYTVTSVVPPVDSPWSDLRGAPGMCLDQKSPESTLFSFYLSA